MPPADSSSPERSAPLWLRLAARLPLPVLRGAGALMGAALYLGARRRRRIAEQNLALCFPEADAAIRRRWAWQTFKHFGQTFVDRVWLWHGPPSLIERRVRLGGELQWVQQPEPVLHFVPHFYGMDAGWARLTLSVNRPWWAFYAPQDNPTLDRWVRQGRQRFGAPQLVSKRDGMRSLLRGLRDGAAVCLLPDMDLGARDSVFVPFFGVQAATVTSLPRLAKAAGVPVVPWVCQLVPGGYEVEVLPPWSDYPSGDDAADARRMNEALEGYVRAMPGQYHWLHRRFKTRPPGEPPLYRR